MGENSQIEWTDHTFNPWMGCTKISPGCDHCYAEVLSRRFGHAKWGNHPRNRTSRANWKKPIDVEWQGERNSSKNMAAASVSSVRPWQMSSTTKCPRIGASISSR